MSSLNTTNPTQRIVAFMYLSASLTSLFVLKAGPFGVKRFEFHDIPLLFLFLIHFAYGLVLFIDSVKNGTGKAVLSRLVPELFLSLTLLFFLFTFIFALNANMDYVQRFIATGGNLRLAPDTRQEQFTAVFRFLPFFIIDCAHYLFVLGARPDDKKPKITTLSLFCNRFGLPLSLLSAGLTAFAFPSFLLLDGVSWLAWGAFVPLFLVLRYVSYKEGIFYGVVYGIFTTVLSNYWLGTFSLVSLQLIILIFLCFYLIFMSILLLFFKKVSHQNFLLFPVGWVAFDFFRSSGFLGYPWGMIGISQYDFLPLIQISSLTGVWGVSFLVVLVNAGIAQWITLPDKKFRIKGFLRGKSPLLGYALITLGAVILIGFITLQLGQPGDGTDSPVSVARIALIQHNADSRKHDYDETFETLTRLTDEALTQNPELIVWSETAFVPNIARWSREDPERYRLARLVRRFLSYQKSLDTWLVTGNDDYRFAENADGEEVRLDYNAAVLFNDMGERVETYHKNHLVPFTEYFPYREQLPFVYDLLLEFDVNFWEPGTERTVFSHPLFDFATPICFEDLFPNEVRKFVSKGADIIINLSNDYWSLTEVEAKQHYIASVFRAVENRRPLLRGTSSGFTGHIDEWGELKGGLPYYQEGIYMADVKIRNSTNTLYTRFGDWFPLSCTIIFFFIIFGERYLSANHKDKTNRDGTYE